MDELVSQEGLDPDVIESLLVWRKGTWEWPLILKEENPSSNIGKRIDAHYQKAVDSLNKIINDDSLPESLKNRVKQDVEMLESSQSCMKSLFLIKPDTGLCWPLKQRAIIPKTKKRLLSYRIYMLVSYIEHFRVEYLATNDNQVCIDRGRNAYKQIKSNLYYQKQHTFELISELFQKLCNQKFFSVSYFDVSKIKEMYDNVRFPYSDELNRLLKKDVLENESFPIYKKI